MNDWVGWTLGLVGVPVIVVAGLAGLRLRLNGRPYAPGSREAVRAGCRCPRRANWFGTRAGLRGEVRVATDCPVLSHRAERVRDVHL